jgi:hypothetical protein
MTKYNLVSCIKCQKQFTSNGLSRHACYNKYQISGTKKYQLICSCVICHQEVSVQNIKNHSEAHSKYGTKMCKECNSIILDYHKNFCNHSCAAKFNSKKRPSGHNSRVTQSLSLLNNQSFMQRKRPKRVCLISWCVVCRSLIKNSKNKTCSDTCLSTRFSLAGKTSAAKIICRSKDEILLFDLCSTHFQSVRHNEQLVDGWDADIIIDDINTAILWNGPWHYKQMPHNNHSLKQVQNRDRIKIKSLTDAGWNVLIFEDRYFSPETAFQSILVASDGYDHSLCPFGTSSL